jgi:hypothetical protein
MATGNAEALTSNTSKYQNKALRHLKTLAKQVFSAKKYHELED